MSDDYFSLLDLGEVKFAIDYAVLEKNYVSIQHSSHPDCFFSFEAKELAVRKIAKVNEAYLVLRSPIKRAEYVLEMKGVKVGEADRSSLVGDVFELLSESEKIKDEISKCMTDMESFFAEGDLYKAALCVEKLKYLRKMSRSSII